MPVIVIDTNVKRDQLPADVLSVIGTSVATILGKTIEQIVVQVNSGQLIAFAGSEDPYALVNLSAVDVVGGEQNKTIVPALSKLIVDTLGVVQGRLLIIINPLQGINVGYNGNALG